jgi:phage-related minor tail protein
MESMDDLLAQVKAEYLKPKLTKPQEQSLIERELNSVELPTVQPKYINQPGKSLAEDSMLAEIKAEFAEKQRAEETKKQQQKQEEQKQKEQQLKEEQNRLQQREKQKKEALTKEATEWLKKLNFRSEEGLWFEEFAYSYPSKLEAAIDYLEALREARS